MAGQDMEAGLKRASSKEMSQQPQGRTGGKVPIKSLTGDSNPTSGGGINRPTKGYKKD